MKIVFVKRNLQLIPNCFWGINWGGVAKNLNGQLYYDVPGSPCLSKTGPMYGPFFYLKIFG